MHFGATGYSPTQPQSINLQLHETKVAGNINNWDGFGTHNVDTLINTTNTFRALNRQKLAPENIDSKVAPGFEAAVHRTLW